MTIQYRTIDLEASARLRSEGLSAAQIASILVSHETSSSHAPPQP
jgi:hypothetical protein